MAYVYDSKRDELTNTKKAAPVEKKPETEETKIVLTKGLLRLRKVGVALLTVGAGVTLVGTMKGAIDIIGLAMHPEIYGIGEWLSFGIPTAINVWCASKLVPLAAKNLKPTASIYDGCKAVFESIKGGLKSFTTDEKGKSR